MSSINCIGVLLICIRRSKILCTTYSQLVRSKEAIKQYINVHIFKVLVRSLHLDGLIVLFDCKFQIGTYSTLISLVESTRWLPWNRWLTLQEWIELDQLLPEIERKPSRMESNRKQHKTRGLDLLCICGWIIRVIPGRVWKGSLII